MDIKNKVAVVTGASAGIGQAIARALSEAGAKLVLTARRAELLTSLAKDLKTESATLAGDISDPTMPDKLLKLAQDRFGRADILINNAGLLVVAPIDTVDLEAVSRMIRVNVEALVRSSYTFAKVFKAQKSGAIINISSIGAFQPSPMVAAYGGTKSAVEAFTAGLRIELAGSGVRVGTVAPGSTETDMYDDLRQTFKIPDHPMVEPADIARGAVYMLQQPDNANIARMQIYSSAEQR